MQLLLQLFSHFSGARRPYPPVHLADAFTILVIFVPPFFRSLRPLRNQGLRGQDLETWSAIIASEIQDTYQSQGTYHGCAAGNINMGAVLPTVPFSRLGEEASALVNTIMSARLLGIRVQHNSVCPGHVDPNPVIAEALGRMEVEDEKAATSLEDDDLVSLVLERDVCLRRLQPTEAALAGVHETIKVVEELVPEQVVVGQVKLAPGVPKGVLVALAGEVQPFRVTKLVTLEVEIALAAETVGQEANHLVQGHPSVDDRGECCQHGHVGVHLSIAEMHHEGLVSNEPNTFHQHRGNI